MRPAKAIKIGVLVVVALAVAAVTLVRSINVNGYKRVLTERVRDYTGRQLSIAGPLQLAFSLNPSIVASGIKLSNAPWAAQPALLTAKRFKAEVELFPLLLGEIRIKQVVVVDPDIALETNAKGRGNWELKGGKQAVKKSGGGMQLPVLEINEVDIRHAHITYRSAKSRRTSTLDIDQLALRSKGLYQPIKVKSSIGYNKNPITIAGTLGSYAKLTANETWPVDLTATSGKASARIQGSIGRPLEAQDIQLAVTAQAPSAAALNGLAGMSLPAAGPLSLTAAVGTRPGELTFTDVHARVDKTEVTGRAHLVLRGAQPALDAELGSSSIDLRTLPKSKKKDGKGPLFPGTPLPLGFLRSFNGTVRLRVDTLKTRSVLLSGIRVTAHVHDGRLTLDPIRANVAEGTISGKATLDASHKPPTLRLRLTAEHLEPGEIGKLQGLISGAPTDIRLDVTGTGDSPHAIAASLDGRFRLVAGRGQIHNRELNLAGADVLSQTLQLVNPLSKKDNQSALECAVVNLDFNKGIARTDKGIAMQTDKMNVIGSGTINLGTEQLDLGVRVDARQGLGINLGEFAHAVRIGGTLTNPEPQADAAGIVREGGTIGAAIATGGLSLLAQKLFDKATGDSHPCATALGRTVAPPPSSATNGGKNATTQPAPAATSPPPKKEEGGVSGFFHKIFGN